jgi:hypothetical protein
MNATLKTAAHLAIAASFVTLTACGANPYYGTSALSEQAGDPTAQIDPNLGIRMAEGSAASAHIELDSQTGGTLTGDIRSQNTSVLEIMHAPHDGSTYVFLAKKAGLAEVFIYTDGVAVRSLNAVVTAPAPSGESTDAGPDAEPDSGDAGGELDAADGGGENDAADAGDGSD